MIRPTARARHASRRPSGAPSALVPAILLLALVARPVAVSGQASDPLPALEPGAAGPSWFVAGQRATVRLQQRLRRNGPARRSPVLGTPAEPSPGSRRAEEADAGNPVGMAAAGILGGGVGFLAGAYAGAMMHCIGDGCSHGGAIAGAWVGSSLGISTGAHLAGGGDGSWGASSLASLGVGGATVLVAALTWNDDLGADNTAAAIVLPLGWAAQVVTTVAVESNTVPEEDDGDG